MSALDIELDVAPAADLEEYVMRFANRKATLKAPGDARLPEYKRERFPIIGRPEERHPDDTGSLATGSDINIMYLRCEPGMGFSLHKHTNWEICIPMTGQWEITCGTGDSIVIGPWDAMMVPGGIYHDAKNVSDTEAYMLGINPGNRQALFKIHPSIVERLKSLDSEEG